jgi:hypothetical protein
VVLIGRCAYIVSSGASEDMAKRAVDLSLAELATMGANAALKAAGEAQQAGLVVTGTVDFLEDGQPASSLAERSPSGAVVLLAPQSETPQDSTETVAPGTLRRGSPD